MWESETRISIWDMNVWDDGFIQDTDIYLGYQSGMSMSRRDAHIPDGYDIPDDHLT